MIVCQLCGNSIYINIIIKLCGKCIKKKSMTKIKHNFIKIFKHIYNNTMKINSNIHHNSPY